MATSSIWLQNLIKQLKQVDETNGQSLENKSLEEKLCILGVPLIRVGAEPKGYNLYIIFIFVKKVFMFQPT